jgi:DNA-binding beta-propeller fold protein YncE
VTVSEAVLPLEVEFEAPADLQEALSAMGRTEDVRLSPRGDRLALACYRRDRIAVADIEVARAANGPRIAIASFEEFASPSLREPHGIDFLDDETLVVANRTGGVGVFRLPARGSGGELTPLGDGARGPAASHGPGSVAVRKSKGGRSEVLVCNNWANTITRHAVAGDGSLVGGEVVAQRWLAIPDGVAISRDGEWLAVSNHSAHCVFLYAWPTLGADAEPDGILRGVAYPHGLRFDDGDRRLLVADAGAPRVHVFDAPDEGWEGVRYPVASVEVLDERRFDLAQTSPEEGGPKGIDVDSDTRVLAVTSESVPLAFFDLQSVLDSRSNDAALVRYELARLAEQERADAETADVRAALAELRSTRAWRLTKPLRAANGVARRLRSRLRA